MDAKLEAPQANWDETMGKKLVQGYHFYWLAQAGIDSASIVALPDELLFNIYGNILSYGPAGDTIVEVCEVVTRQVAADLPKTTVDNAAQRFSKNPLLSAIHALGETNAIQRYDIDKADAEALGESANSVEYAGLGSMWANIVVLAQQLDKKIPQIYRRHDWDYFSDFSSGLILACWEIGGLGAHSTESPAIQTEVAQVKAALARVGVAV